MKYLISFLLFVNVAFFMGCSDPCRNVECVNGECINGECDCFNGYEGPSCANERTPDAIRITKIIVTDFPYTDDGSNWDAFDGPDIYVTFSSENAVLFESGYYEDAEPTQNYEFECSINLTNLAERHVIRLREYDDFGDNDIMDGVEFNVWNNLKNRGFPEESSEIYYEGSKARFKIEVSYVFN